MPLELRNATFQDGEAIAHVYISAFAKDPFHNTSFPNMPYEKQVAGVISRWPSNYGSLNGFYKVVVDTDTNEIVAYSKWSFSNTTAGSDLRKTDIPSDIEVKPPSTPEGLNDPFAIEHTAKVLAIQNRVLGDRPVLHLKMFGTSPKAWGRGAASLQLAWAASLADEKGIACWVDAAPISVSLYKKFGFKIQDTVVMDMLPSAGGGTYTHTAMLREPRNQE